MTLISMRRRGRLPAAQRVSLVLVLLSCAAVGCFGPIAQVPRRQHMLTAISAAAQTPLAPAPIESTHTEAPQLGAVRVDDFVLAPALDKAQVLQRLGPTQVHPHAQDVWAARPGAMLAEMMATTLSDTHLFAQVSRSPGELRETFALEGEVQSLALVRPAQAEFAWRLQLVRTAAPKQVVWRSTWHGAQDFAAGDAGAGIAALQELTRAAARAASEALIQAPLQSASVPQPLGPLPPASAPALADTTPR